MKCICVDCIGKEKIVYICSAYSGDIESNTDKAKEYCKFALSENVIPFAPHLFLPQFMTEDEREQVMKICLSFIDRCDELWAFGDMTEGMEQEINYAAGKMPIKSFPSL